MRRIFEYTSGSVPYLSRKAAFKSSAVNKSEGRDRFPFRDSKPKDEAEIEFVPGRNEDESNKHVSLSCESADKVDK